MVNNTITTNVKVLALLDKMGQAIANVEQIQEQLTNTVTDIPPPNTAPALDMNFREWVKQSVYDTGRTITEFCNETGLSRQLTNAHSQTFDPSMANFMLVCEVLSVWQCVPLESVVLTAIRTTKAYRTSASRLPHKDKK